MGPVATSQPDTVATEYLHKALLTRIGRLRGYVVSKVPARLRNVILADEVLHELWIAAYRTFPTFKPGGPDALDRWLFTIANSKLVDALRAVRRTGHVGKRALIRNADQPFTSFSDLFERLSPEGVTPSGELHAAETGHAILISLNRLNDARRQAIQLCYFDGLSRKEIAHKMGKSKAAVNTLLFNGLRELRHLLGDAEKYFSDVRSPEPKPTDTLKR